MSSFLGIRAPITLFDTLLPESITKKIANRTIRTPAEICALSCFVGKVAIGAHKALQSKMIKQLDPNPGDGGCQIRAAVLHHLLGSEVISDELKKIQEAINELIKVFKDYKGSEKAQRAISPLDLFMKEREIILVSQELRFILLCYLLQVLRMPCEISLSGIIRTKSEISLMSRLEPSIEYIDGDYRKEILNMAQSNLSLISAEKLRELAAPIESLSPLEKLMISEEHTKKVIIGDYPTKHFVCLPYAAKTALAYLRDTQALVGFKSIVPKGKEPFLIFLQSKEKGSELLPLDDISSFDPSRLIVIFEALMKADAADDSLVADTRESVLHFLETHSFSDMVLRSAALAPPFEPGSTLKEIKEDPAQTETLSFGEKGQPYHLDHVYTITLKEAQNSLGVL